VTTLLICGSRFWSQEAAARDLVDRAVERAAENNYHLVVGDAPGVDAWVCAAAIEHDLRRHTYVWGIAPQPRNEWPGAYLTTAFGPAGESPLSSYRARDDYLISLADVVLCVWNGHSSGTQRVYERALASGRDAHLRCP